MARKTLGSLLSVAEDPAADTAPGAESTDNTSHRDASTPPGAGSEARRAKPPTGDDPPAAPGPRYLALTRKEARFTDDQLDELSALTRQLNKTRQGRGERITDNTLIRVAVDLLLQRADELAGHDENELRQSVGL